MTAPAIEASAEPRWNRATLIAFRVVCVYFLFEWVPLVVTFNLEPLTLGAIAGPNWFARQNLAVGQWVVLNVLGLPEHSAAVRLSGSNLSLFLGMVAAGVVSIGVALAWTAIDSRRPNHARLFLWMHTFMRFMLAIVMLTYGWAKVLPDQFALSLDYIALEVGQHNPRDLLWAFMTGSRWYQVFTGSVEVAAGVFLLTRRTALLGGLMSVAAMANVVALDIAYDAPVKFLAGQVLLIASFIVAPFAARLVDVFVFNRASAAPLVRRLFRRASADRMARAAGVVVGLVILYGTWRDINHEVRDLEASRETPLYGIWDVVEVNRNGAAVPLLVTDPTLWRRLVVHARDSAVVIPMSDPARQPAISGRSTGAIRHGVELNTDERTVQFTPFPFYGTTKRWSFGYEVQDPHQLMLTSRDGDEVFKMRFRRFDQSYYPLLVWERSWRW